MSLALLKRGMTAISALIAIVSYLPDSVFAQAEAEFDKNEAAPQNDAIPDENAEQITEPFAQMFSDEEVVAKTQRALFRKMRGNDSALLHSWLGEDECDLAARWGSPSSSYSKRDTQFLTYSYGYDRHYVFVPGRYVPQKLERRYSCNMTFKVSRGIIQDYRFHGNHCGPIETSRLARGPN
jgi:hypothetical protein